MNRFACVALLLALSGCSSEYDNPALKLSLKLPQGCSDPSTDNGPPLTVSFDCGLKFVSVDEAMPGLGQAPMDALLEQALTDAKVGATGEVVSSRQGDLGGQKCARFEIKEEKARQLVYLVPRKNNYLLIQFRGSGSSYGQKEAGVERALGTLKIRD